MKYYTDGNGGYSEVDGDTVPLSKGVEMTEVTAKKFKQAMDDAERIEDETKESMRAEETAKSENLRKRLVEAIDNGNFAEAFRLQLGL